MMLGTHLSVAMPYMRWFSNSVIISCFWLLLLLASVTPSHAYRSDDESVTYFEKHIRPLLSQQCHSCHGSQKQKGGLRLDEPEWIKKGGDTGKVIVAGMPEKSLLYQAVSYQHDDLKMPPRGKLSSEQIEHIRIWIEKGAALPVGSNSKTAITPFNMSERAKHWCYQPLQQVSIPLVKDKSHVRTPIDAFIQHRWQELALKPAPEVTKIAWLRRVTFDLTGLPPTMEEINALEKDDSAQAYEKVVDRLLARPEYGERWARHWLDLMRYADTLGHEFDFDLPNAWRYRNYVIRALNDDVPYRQFVMEHLAGDLLSQPRMNNKEKWNESIQATGFLWLGEAKQAPVDVKQEQADRIDNQIDVIGKAFMGQTIACARCHDHKFDAIATRDYYALYGVLKSSRYQQAIIDDLDRLQQVLKLLRELQSQTQQMLLAPEAPAIPQVKLNPDYREHDLKNAQTQGIAWQLSGTAGSAVFHDPKTKAWRTRYIPAHVWDSGSLSEVLEGALRTSTFTIDQRYLHLEAVGRGGRIRIVIDGFPVIRDPIYGSLRKVVNDPQAKWYSFDLNMWQGRQAYVEFLDGGPADLSLMDDHAPGREAWLQIRRLITSNAAQAPMALISPDVEQQLLKPFNPDDAFWKWALAELHKLEQQIPAARYALATADGTGDDEHIFIRGNHRSPGETATRGLSPLFCGLKPIQIRTGSGRLELADRLTDPACNPLIARVIVNRVWKHHFGEGLVRSVDDMGHMGETPSHPELLDYLATWFIQEGWSLKKLHRLMVLSHTYRLASSNGDEATNRLDPQLRWLSHMPMRRLEAEAIRDAMLAISGRLQHEQVEAGVMPYLTAIMQGRGRPSISGPLDGNKYRSIYQSVRRNFLPTLMTCFDFPTPFTAIGKRSLSNTPSQGLTMMNDPLVKELARHWATEMIKQYEEKTTRLQAMYISAFARVPGDEEKELAFQFLAEQQGNENSAWTELAHALFCSKEFLFIP